MGESTMESSKTDFSDDRQPEIADETGNSYTTEGCKLITDIVEIPTENLKVERSKTAGKGVG